MINIKIFYRIMGSLLFIESGLLLVCVIMSLCYGESDMKAFVYSTLIAIAAGSLLKYCGRNAENRMTRRDGYLVVSAAWVFFSLIGMLPFLFSGACTSSADAFFETMSGFTTTGATILNNIDQLPHAILFWRSLTHWIGGLGIVFFTLALLPTLGLADVKLFAAEATGPSHNKLHPRIRTTAKWLWMVYIILTAACTISLFFGGMNWFDAINHAFATTSTGGFSTRQAGIMFYKSPAIEYVEIVFMFLAGVNFTLLYLLILKGKIKTVFRDTEFRTYLGLTVGFSLIIALLLIIDRNYPIERALRLSFFNLISLETTTGYVSEDFGLWPPLCFIILSAAMFIGACAGSTTGGMKCVRVSMLFKIATNEFKHIIHPNAVLPVRINRTAISSSLIRTLISFMFFYIGLIIVGASAMILMGVPVKDAFSIAITSESNTGPALGHLFSPLCSFAALPDAAKWICSFLMLAGRLEIFSILLPFLPRFWNER